MAIVVTNVGSAYLLNLLRQRFVLAEYAGPIDLFMGLFQSDWNPDRLSTLASFTPCNFPGYAGLVKIPNWVNAAAIGDRSFIQADRITWTYAGVGTVNFVYGYYVVSSVPELLWAERDPNGPTGLVQAPQSYSVIPRFGQRSTYPIEP